MNQAKVEAYLEGFEALRDAVLMARRTELNDFCPRPELIKLYEAALDKAEVHYAKN